jgi:hypothetical protein
MMSDSDAIGRDVTDFPIVSIAQLKSMRRALAAFSSLAPKDAPMR